MNDSLQTSLTRLRLSGMATTLDVRLQEAAGHQLGHGEFLELVLQDELLVRDQRLIERRTKAAGFRERRTLDEFDFSFNPSVKRRQIFELATGRFIREARDILLIGPPGVGKSHIAQALGYQAQLGNIQLAQQFEDLHHLAVLHYRISLYYDWKFRIGRFQLT